MELCIGKNPGRHVGMGPILVPGASAGGAAGGTYELDTEVVGNVGPGAPVEAAFGGTYELETALVGKFPMLVPDELALLLAAGGLKHLLA